MPIWGEPCKVRAIQKGKELVGFLSTLQVKMSLKNDETTFLLAPCMDDQVVIGSPMPPLIDVVLKDLGDVMPAALPKGLPQQRTVNHKIKLVSSVKPLARARY